MIEKRKQGRKSPKFFIGVYDQEKTRQVGRVVNINRRGLMVIGKHELRRYSDYNVILQLSSQYSNEAQLTFVAQCRWCERGGRSKLFSSGLEITIISATNFQLLKEFLEHPLVDDGTGVSQISVVIESES